ncbi:MAG: error-prone DNA polymerase, partial [Bdellovibrionales bacterium]|nr:error-prone DNA polymerase [Bdellovibrionales bacterium]
MERYHEWLVKTNFSFLKGASFPSDLIFRAYQLGYSSLCVNDFDGVYGLARCYRELKRIKKQYPDCSLSLQYGAEIHFSKDHDRPIALQDTISLIVRNAQGYKNLCSILSHSHRSGKKYAHISIDEFLSMDTEGLSLIQPMRGWVRKKEGEDYIKRIHAKHRENFYLALSLHCHPSEDLWAHRVLSWSEKYKIQTLCSQDVFFHHQNQKMVSDLLISIGCNKRLSQSKHLFFSNHLRSMQKKEILEKIYKKIPCFRQSMENSERLYQDCDFSLSSLCYHYPKEMIPEGLSSQEYLKKMVWENAYQKFSSKIPAKVQKTLLHELDLIQKLDFSDYFLTVWNIVRWARSRNILCQGRGSAANSAICFVLGITAVDPSQYDLLFERFMSMERGDPPDIDVDFEHERREEVVQYIYKQYGREKAAMVANVITYRKKGAIRAVGKALGIEEAIIRKASQLSSTKFFRGHGIKDTILSIKNEKEDFWNIAEHTWRLWIELSQRILGFPRHLGIHSGGFMISHIPIHHLVAQEPASMEGRTIVQWSKEDIEGLGFFKIDVLCLGMLTAIRKCFDLIAQSTGRRLTMYSLPYDDQETYQMIQRADTVGTFQIESRAQMSMLPRLKPQTFYDLVIEIAIIRPGPIQGKVIHPYLQRRESREKISYPHEKLRPILERTLGIPIFQEQAMRIAIAVGNFTPGEANELRKNIGLWNMKDFVRDLDPWIIKLQKGMRENHIPEDFIMQTVGQLKGFVHYGFPESHAVSFALIAYVSCYLKKHYPAQYFVAMLNSQPVGFYSSHALLQAAKRDGVEILPICIEKSFWDNSLKKKANGDICIRLGFRLIRGLSQKGIEGFLQSRESGKTWRNLDDFLKNHFFYRLDATALAAANAFFVWEKSRSDALWKVQAIPFCPLL